MRRLTNIMLLFCFACQTASPIAKAPEEQLTAPAAAPVPVSCGDVVDDGHLEWLDGFIVSWQFVLDPSDGTVTIFEGSAYGSSLDPAQARMVGVSYADGAEHIELRSFSGELRKSFDVPTFVEAPELEPDRVAMLRSSQVHWWSDHEVLVVQDLLPSEFYVACQMLNVETGVWRPAGDCPSGDMVDLGDIRRGPADLVELVTSGEGHPAVNVVHWAPNTPQKPTELPSFDLYPFGPMTVRFTQDPDEFFIESPCDLRLERGCQPKVDDGEDYSVFLFRWRSDRGLTMERSALPPGATYDPETSRWAWPTTKGIAVGDPDGEFVCHEIAWPAE